MKRNFGLRLLVVSIMLIAAGWLFNSPAGANDMLRYASSAQVPHGPQGATGSAAGCHGRARRTRLQALYSFAGIYSSRNI